METDIRLDVFWKDEVFAAIIRTRTPDACAMTAIHSTRLPRHIGGARLVASGGEEEVLDLALAMTEKCLAAGIRAGGQKSLVVCAPHILTSESAKAYVLEDHFREVKRHFPGVIFGPDMANPESVMDRVSLQPDLLDHVTGLSEARGGYGIDQSGFTAVGVVEATRLAAKWLQLATSRVAIQGFGAVGAHSGGMLDSLGYPVVAVSNACGSILCADGLPMRTLFDAWQDAGDEGVMRAARALGKHVRTSEDPTDIFRAHSDILIPAARTSCIAMPEELVVLQSQNPQVLSAERFLSDTGVKLIVEGANHPLSHAAESFLESRNVTVLPDVLVNCGGLIGCWQEHEARHEGRPLRDREQVFNEIRNVVLSNINSVTAGGWGAREGTRQIIAERLKDLSSAA